MEGCVIEDQAISHAQYLDLVYSQSGALYDLLIDAQRPSMDTTSSKSLNIPPVDGIIESMSQTSNKASLKQKFVSNIASNPPSKPSSNPGKTSKVNVIRFTTIDKAPKDKKKGKEKVKFDTPKKDPPKSPTNDASKCKPNYPCLIGEEDHYTKDSPHHTEVIRLLKGTQVTSVVLKEPFPSQQTQLVEQTQSFASSGSQGYMSGTMPIFVATRSKDYQTPQKQMVEKEITDAPSTFTPPSSSPLHIERPNNDYVIRPPPKGVLRKSSQCICVLCVML